MTMIDDVILCQYDAEVSALRVARARLEASNRGAMLWTGQPHLGHPAYWVTLPSEKADTLQCLRVIAAVDAALGVTLPLSVRKIKTAT